MHRFIIPLFEIEQPLSQNQTVLKIAEIYLQTPSA